MAWAGLVMGPVRRLWADKTPAACGRFTKEGGGDVDNNRSLALPDIIRDTINIQINAKEFMINVIKF